MKAIILGQKRGIRKLSSRESYPSILKKYGTNNDSVMSSLLSSLKDAGIRDIVYVGGYHIEKVIQEHNDIKYYYYKKWESESDISALMEAKSEFNTDILVLQSDVVFRSQLVRLIAESKKQCLLGVNKSEELAHNEKIKFPRIIQNNTNVQNDLYFSGLAFLSKKFINENFDILTSKTFYKNSKSLLDWLYNAKIDENKVDLLNVGEYWTSVYAPLGLAKFIFGTKAQTLERIKPLISKSIILPQFSFTLRAWEKSEIDVINNIVNSDFGPKIVVRSSSKYEDSWTSSQAGKFHSELNVDTSNKIQITSAINKVIKSYFNANCYDLDNEILVQPFFTDIMASGVVFGCDMDNLSPYYIVNSDSKSRRSDTVPSGNGASLDTKIIYKNFDNSIEDKWHDSLLASVKEIQRAINYEAIDIEFIVSNNEEVFILQVRPLIVSANSNIQLDEEFDAQLDLTRKFYNVASTTDSEINSGFKLFSNMSDWNPAEMIGSQPKPLQSSIYQILITNHIWALARFQCGYRKAQSTQLMHLFSGNILM